MKIIYTTIQVVFIALMVGVAGLFILPLLPIDNNIELRIVESGSMEPTIMTGSLVVIAPAATYGVGDVVTFKSATADVPTTHRIIDSINEEGGQNYFITKGDANEEADTAALRVEDVIGRIAIDVPYAGFILDFARQPIGFSLLILLPAFMIIVSEIEKIWMEVRNRRKGVVASSDEDGDEIEPDDGGLTDRVLNLEPVRMMDIATPVQYKLLPTLDLRNKLPIQQNSPAFSSIHKNNLSQWATICLVLIGSSIFVSASFLPYTASYFNDIERTIDNTLGAVMLDFTVSSEFNIFNFLGTSLDSEGSSVVNVVEPENGSAGIRYDIAVEYKGGSQLFCDAILADMTVLPTIYSGSLLALTASDVNFAGPWSLVLSLDENITGYLAGDFCQVDVVYTAWHQDVDSDTGYHDEERVPLTFYAPSAEPLARFAPSAELLLLSTSDENQEGVVEEEDETNDVPEGFVEILVPVDLIEPEEEIEEIVDESQIPVEKPEITENVVEEVVTEVEIIEEVEVEASESEEREAADEELEAEEEPESVVEVSEEVTL